MAEQPLHRRPDGDLEAALRGLGDAIAWPASGPATGGGPDLAAVVRQRIESSPRGAARAGSRWAWRPARRALVVAVIILLALAAITGAATLGLPGLRLILGPAPVSPPPSLEPSRPPSASPGPSALPGARLRLGQPVALADLDARAGFHVTWPEDPAIGPPDAAYIDPTKGGQVALVWSTRPDLPATLEPGVGLLLTQFRGFVENGFFTKAIGGGTFVRLVLVDGEQGYWLSGDPHFLFYESPTGSIHDDRRWVGDTLLWSVGPLTYRLETSLGQDAAIRIAESMP